MAKKEPKTYTPEEREAKVRRLRAFESTATFGLLLLAVGLVAPFTSLENGTLIAVFKWIYAAGALVYLVARICGGYDPADSLRVRRLRRLEVWAGIAFGIAAFFWFYNTAHFSNTILTLPLMRDTVIFTLVGALIQIIASWMIVSIKKKEMKKAGEQEDKKPGKKN